MSGNCGRVDEDWEQDRAITWGFKDWTGGSVGGSRLESVLSDRLYGVEPAFGDGAPCCRLWP